MFGNSLLHKRSSELGSGCYRLYEVFSRGAAAEKCKLAAVLISRCLSAGNVSGGCEFHNDDDDENFYWFSFIFSGFV